MLSAAATATLPLGSQIHSHSVVDSISRAREVDVVEFSLAAGDTLTVAVEPAGPLMPEVVVVAPDFRPLATATATAAGEPLLLQTVPIDVAGNYAVTIGGGVTTGAYRADIILNAALDAESMGGPSNDSRDAAQSIDAAFIPVGTSDASRGAVLGSSDGSALQEDFETGQLGPQWTTASSNSRGRIETTGRVGTASGDFALLMDRASAGTPVLNEAIWTVDLANPTDAELRFFHADFNDEEHLLPAQFVGSADGDGVAISGDGSVWHTVFSPVASGEGWEQIVVDLAAESAAAGIEIGAGLQIKFQQFDDNTLTVDGRGYDDIQIVRSSPWEDWHRFTLADAESAALYVATVDENPQDVAAVALELYDAAGVLLAVSRPRDHGLQSIQGFVDPTSDGAAQEYFARVTGDAASSSDYSLVVTRNAILAAQSDPPEDITHVGSVLGAIGSIQRPIVEESEPNDDGLPGGSSADLQFANDWSDSFTAIGNDQYAASLRGDISLGDDADWDFFKVFASPGDRIEIEMRGEPSGLGSLADPFLWLFDNSGNIIALNDDFFGLEPLIDFSDFLYAGDYYVVADSFGSLTGDYELSAVLTTANFFQKPLDADVFKIAVNQGDDLQIAATIPAERQGIFTNELNIALELADPAGNLVAETTDASLTHSAQSTGTYEIRVLAEGQAGGDYVLDAAGSTALPRSFRVEGSNPSDGASLTSVPTEFRVDLSQEVLVSTVDAADLIIDLGSSAEAVQIVDGSTLLFELPPLQEGSHLAAIPAGAFTSLAGDPLEAFVILFSLDFTAPRIVSSNLQPGDVLTPGELMISVVFDETLAADALSAADVSLRGIDRGIAFSPAEFDYNPDNSTLTLEFDDLPEDRYRFSLSSGDGAFEDLAGNDLDGEVIATPIGENLTGDGAAGGDFTLEFFLDEPDATQFPAPLEAIPPLGSLVYAGELRAAINTAGDVDEYFLEVDDDQTVTVIVQADSGVTPAVTFGSPGSPLAATTVAAGRGEPAVLTNLPAFADGDYIISVAGADDEMGSYSVEVILNASVEQENFGGPANDDRGSAQSLAGDFTPLGALGAQVAAILGRGDGETRSRDDWFEFALADGEAASLSLRTVRSANLELYDNQGALLARAAPGVNASHTIANFVDATDNGRLDQYFVRMSGFLADYSFVVVRGASFDQESNSESLFAQDVGESLGVLGHIRGDLVEAPPARIAEPVDAAAHLRWQPSARPFADGQAERTVRKSSQPVAKSDAKPVGSALGDLPVAEASTRLEGIAAAGAIPILQTFPGPGFSGSVPPDPIAAAGPAQVVGMVNTDIGIYDKSTGEELFLQSLNGPDGFFGEVGATVAVFDPWILFDDETQRFFALGIDIASNVESNVYLAVSTDDTPTSGDDWHKYKIDFTHIPDDLGLGSGAHFPDYPKMGVSDDAIFISGNYFPIGVGSGVYAGITAIAKEPLLDGGPAAIVYEEFFDGFSVMPMTQYDSPSVQYFVEASTGGGDSLTVHAVSDVLGSPVRDTAVVAVPDYDAPVAVPQLGSLALADAIDARVMTGVYRDGSMWFAHAITDPAATDDESLVRWYQVDVAGFPGSNGPTLVQAGNVDPGPDVHAWMPAIAVDGNNNMGLGFSIGGPNQFYGAAFTGRLETDFLGETAQIVTEYAPGLESYTDGGFFGVSRWGDYSGLAIDPSDDATFWAFNLFASTSNNWATQFASFQLQQPIDDDWLQFAVNEGDILRIETLTPGDGPFELVNELDPDLEFFAPDGTAIAYDNRVGNELLFHVAETTGQYRLRLFAEDTEGEYFVQIEGATGENLPPAVVDFQPSDGDRLAQLPENITLVFSESLFTPSVSADDVLIGGLPALSVNQRDGISFDFEVDPAANVGDGFYLVEVASGVVADLQRRPNVAATAVFELDTTPPVILETLWNGLPLTASRRYDEGPLTFQAAFSEDLYVIGSARRGPFSPGIDDVVLTEESTGDVILPMDVQYSPESDLLEAHFDPLPEGDYFLTLFSGTGALEDRVGNDLDGEPASGSFDGTPTGDGIAGGDFVVHFTVDAVQPQLEPFVAARPLGSMMTVSDGTLGLINAPRDQDDYRFFLEGGQTLAAVLTPVDPTATASLEVVGLNTVATASAPGEAVVLPVTPITAAALYDLRVSADVKTRFELDVFVNAATEAAVGDTNDANPFSIDSSLIALGSGRYAVAAVSDAIPPQAPRITQETEPNDDGFFGASPADLQLANDWSGSFLPVSRESYRASVTGNIQAGNDADWDFYKILASPGDQFTANLAGSPSGVGSLSDPFLWLYDNTGLLLASNDDFNGLESSISYDSFAYAGDYYVVADSFGAETGTYLLSGLLRTGAPLFQGEGEPDVDVFTLDLSGKSGVRIDVVLAGRDDENDFSDQTLELLDDQGQVLATASSDPLNSGEPAANVDLAILDFAVPDIGANLLTLRFTSEIPGDYGLLVTEDLIFGVDSREEAIPRRRSLDASTSAIGSLGDVAVARLVGSDRAGNLFAINLDSGAGTLIGTLENPSTEIEFDPASGRAFSQFPNGSFAGQEFDIETGAPVGLPVDNLGAYTGLEWIDGQLFGTVITGPGGQPSELRILDPYVGTSILVGPTGQSAISGLAYDPHADVLFGIAGGGGPANLYTLDRNTGAATVIGSTELQAGSLEFGPDGNLYAGGTGGNAGNLYRIDPETGASTLVGQSGFGPTTGLMLVPLPAGTQLSPSGEPVSLDAYQVTLLAGQTLSARTTALLDHPLSQPTNLLDPALAILDPRGELVVYDDNSLDGKNALASIRADVAGTYQVQVQTGTAAGGVYLLATSKGPMPGDFDDDDALTGLDFLRWQRGNGVELDAVVADGDANGDGAVDDADRRFWESGFGATSTSYATALTPSSDEATPPPSGAELLSRQRDVGAGSQPAARQASWTLSEASQAASASRGHLQLAFAGLPGSPRQSRIASRAELTDLALTELGSNLYSWATASSLQPRVDSSAVPNPPPRRIAPLREAAELDSADAVDGAFENGVVDDRFVRLEALES